MRIKDLLLTTADHGRYLQDSNGAIAGGTNGPYQTPETPVRNTSHWLITFSIAYDLTGDTSYQAAADGAIDYLTGQRAMPYDDVFFHRIHPTYDLSNGLIGQAWSIEALAIASEVFDREDCRSVAERVFRKHSFHDQLGLWEQNDITGSPIGYDFTFNHQLWFAAAGSLLGRSPEIQRQVRTFLNCLSDNMSLTTAGLINHWVERGPAIADWKGVRTTRDLAFHLRNARNVAGNAADTPKLNQKAVGYHPFNTYAIGMLYEEFPGHWVWESPLIKRSLARLACADLLQQSADNPYAFSYNPVGIEAAYSLSAFEEDPVMARRWLNEQVRRTIDPTTSLMCKGTEDSITLMARLYEIHRLLAFPQFQDADLLPGTEEGKGQEHGESA